MAGVYTAAEGTLFDQVRGQDVCRPWTEGMVANIMSGYSKIEEKSRKQPVSSSLGL